MKGLKETVFQTALIALAIVGTLHFIGNKSDSSRAREIDAKSPLIEDQVRRLIIDFLRNQLILQEKGKDTKVYTGVRKAVFTEIKDGSIEMDVPTRGWTFEPGLTLGASESLRLGVDVQWAYWRRWGMVTGFSVPAGRQRTLGKFKGHLGLSYNFYNKYFPGTSVWGGMDTSADPALGVRTRF